MKRQFFFAIILLLTVTITAQEKKLSGLVIDKYSISKTMPENAKDISIFVYLKNKDIKTHAGLLKVDIKDQSGKLLFQNEKEVSLDTGKTTVTSYNVILEDEGKYCIHYTYSDDNKQILEKSFFWETKPVNFFYSFATPHRMTVTLPDNSNKTLLDLYNGKLELSWTYDNLLYFPFESFRPPTTNWKIIIQPLLNDKPFADSKWERSEGFLPVLKNIYEDKGAILILEVSGGDSAAMVKIILKNTGNSDLNIKLPCVCPGNLKGYNPGWIDHAMPIDYLLAGWGAPADKIIILGIGADKFMLDPKITTQITMNWDLKPGETKTGWLIRPYNSFNKDASNLKIINWQQKFDQSKEIWKSLFNRTCHIIIPDSGVTNGFYSCIGDIFVMREPIGKGYIAALPGTEIYRSGPNSFEPAIVAVALDQIGLHNEAELGYNVDWDIQTSDGDWSEPGGWSHLMWGAAGYKAWALMEHFYNTGDTSFLKKRYPQMLACSRWQQEQRKKTKVMIDGEKPLTYGLMPRGMGDGGLMDDDSYYGIFYTHNIWAVFLDSLTYKAALILGKKEDADELKKIFDQSKSDLITAMELGAIKDKDGNRWLSSMPGKISGSCWGLLNSIYPTNLLPANHELMNNTIKHFEERMSPGGIPVHTGWMVDGMWVAITLNDFAEAHLARGEGDIANAFLYATLNHGTPLYTWCEERGQDPGTIETSGDRQHLWTPEAVVRCIRDMIIMEDGNILHLLRGCARGWLASGEYIGVENASSHFGTISYKVRFIKDESKLSGEIHFPKSNQDFKTILHCPLPGNMKVVKASGSSVLPDGSGVVFEKCSGDVSFEAIIK
jgi:hypothetical protein